MPRQSDGVGVQISRQVLEKRWLYTTLAATLVFGVLWFLDFQLKQLSGYGTFDLQGFVSGAEFETAFHSWGVHAWLARAGFNLGLDYLFMPLYALAFFYSGIIVCDAFAPRPGPVRRILALAAIAPVVAAGLDAVENALQMQLMIGGPTDALAQIAFTVSTAKMAGIYIGLLLLAGAVFARVQERKKRALAARNLGP
jgi:hypothetical protein